MFSTSEGEALPVRTPENSCCTTSSVLIIFSSASSKMSSSAIMGEPSKLQEDCIGQTRDGRLGIPEFTLTLTPSPSPGERVRPSADLENIASYHGCIHRDLRLWRPHHSCFR